MLVLRVGGSKAGIILVKDAMTRRVKTVALDSSIKEAAQKMNKFEIGSVVVVQGKRPVGIITERDLLRQIVEPWLDPEVVNVRNVTTTPLTTIREEATLEEAAEIMMNRRIKKLPVVKNGKLVGIVTATDLTRNAPQLIDRLEDLLWRSLRVHP